jgi:hypothetical protein
LLILPVLGCEGVFDGAGTGAGPSRASCDVPRVERPALQRRTAAQYRAAVGALFRGRGLDAGVPPVPPMPVAAPFSHLGLAAPFTALSAAGGLDLFDVEDAWGAAATVAPELVERLQRDTRHCVSRTPAADACARTVFEEALPLLWGRPPSPAELDGYVAAVRFARAELSATEALVEGLRMALSSPEFLFRSELGEAGRLTSHEVAAALAAQLTDGVPDVELWSAAQADVLRDVDAIRAHVRRLTAQPERLQPLRRFLREYLRFDTATGVFKDGMAFPWHRPGALVDDTERVVEKLVAEHARKGLLRELLTSDLVFVRRDTRLNWGITTNDVPPEGEFRRDASRAGVLTHPSWLAGMSENDHNHLVRRGRFIRERLLCGSVPSLPIGVVPVVAQGAGLTFRERVERHSEDPSCWGCHRLMDPLAYAFEGWDHVGRPQATDNGSPVKTQGWVDEAGSTSGTYADARELMALLAESPEVQACWVKHLFVAYRGREPAEDDQCELERLTRVYVESGEDTLAVVEALFTAPSFLSRSPLEPAP